MTVVVDPTESGASGTTLEDIIRRVRSTLNDNDRRVNKLNADIDDATATITFKYDLPAFAQGDVFTIDDEQFLGWEKTGKTVSVERGWNGTVPAYHETGTLTYNGGKSRKQIIDAINDELMSLSGDLYQMRSLSLDNYSSGTWAYSDSLLQGANIYDVQYLTSGQDVDWNHISGWRQSSIDNAIVLNQLPYWGNNVRVLYKAPFNKFSDGGEDIQSDAGLQSEAADVLVYGACYRLTIGDEYIRDDFRNQGDTRRPSEVPPGAVLRSSLAGFKSLRDERLSEERNRLQRQFPSIRKGW